MRPYAPTGAIRPDDDDETRCIMGNVSLIQAPRK